MSDYIYWVSVVEDTLVHQPGVHSSIVVGVRDHFYTCWFHFTVSFYGFI